MTNQLTTTDNEIARTQLKELKEWAWAKIDRGHEPPWAWYQYMKLIEVADHDHCRHAGYNGGRFTGIGSTSGNASPTSGRRESARKRSTPSQSDSGTSAHVT